MTTNKQPDQHAVVCFVSGEELKRINEAAEFDGRSRANFAKVAIMREVKALEEEMRHLEALTPRTAGTEEE
jgi:hypothetical protein